MLKGLILIGGKSSRMGTEKYKLAFHQKAQFEHLTDLFEGIGIASYISCNNAQHEELQKNYNTIADQHEGIGPIGGILSAFETYPDATWLVIACDLPFVTVETIQNLIMHRDTQYDITAYQVDSRYYETTFSIYEPTAVSQLKNSLSHGNGSLQTVMRNSSVKVVKADNNSEFFNVNTPDDFAAYKQLKNK